jgi:spermidine synthase
MKGLKRYIPHTVVFVSSMGIMIIELVASRIIAKYFGNSLYTWTAIIGVVLGGITLGNYLGGKMADRFRVKDVARVMLLTGAGLTLLILGIDFAIEYGMTNLEVPEHMLALAGVAVLTIGVMFFLPSTALGTISPVMAKYALEEADKVGTTVGSIYASGSAGSIIGTFLSGFLLVPLFGIRTVIVTVAAVIALLSLLIRGKKQRRASAGVLSVIVVVFFAVELAPAFGLYELRGEGVIFETDSKYSHITVEDKKDDERVLVMDGLIHNRYDMSDPDRLLYEYERIFRAATDRFIETRSEKGPGPESLKTLTLGGGALTFPSYLERHYEQSRNHVVEIDPLVVELAHEYFDVPKDTDMQVHIADARQYVRATEGEGVFDIIYLDVFDSYSVPSHLTTKEFAEELKELMDEDGMLLVNLIDIFSIGKFLAAYEKTVSEVFSEVEVFGSVDFDRDRRSTFVLLAGEELDAFDLLRNRDGERFTRIRGYELDRLKEKNRSPLLTDNYVPVENLIAPVFLDAIK